jgi:acetyl-CoA carboxylase carboxyl transferase subunit beta
MDTEKRTQHLTERLTYIKDIFGDKQQENIRLLESKLEEFIQRENGLSTEDKFAALVTLEDLFGFVERNLEN